jgi:F1F0 ATPase subunit 2
MTPDWTMFALGLLGGAAASALFFGGLALGMRVALRAARPAGVLLLSAALRIALLLAVVWWVTGQGMAPLGGFALGFLAARFAILASQRPRLGPGVLR